MRKAYKYIVYDLFGRELMKGTAKAVSEALDVYSTSINHYAKCHSVVKKKYRILIEGDKPYDGSIQRKPIRKKPIEPNRFEKQMDFLIRHLQAYGNTIIPDNDYYEEFMNELKNRGYECKSEFHKNYSGENITLNNNAFTKRVIDYDIVVRLV